MQKSAYLILKKCNICIYHSVQRLDWTKRESMRRVVQVLLRHIMSFVRMLKARRGPGQARPGQARPGHAKAAACKQSDNRWHFARALGSACCVYLTVRVSLCVYTHMHTYTYMYMCAHGPLYCQAAVQSLIMLMDIRFDLVELTRHTLLLLSSPLSLFSSFFRAGQSRTNELPFDVIYIYIYTVCVVARASSQCLAIYLA